MLSKTISSCRICGPSTFRPVLDLGERAPANSLRSGPHERLQRVPLVLCCCESCGIAQLTETIDPMYLFSDYVWVTGTSQAAVKYSEEFCDNVLNHSVSGQLHVLEVASNDGTFLKVFQNRGHVVLGIDPAKNIAAVANSRGVPTWAEFFCDDTAAVVRDEFGCSDVAFARNVLPHVPDPVSVLRGMASCLNEDGLAVIEFHDADIIINGLHYDSLYHEHLFYYSLVDMENLLGRAGLRAFDVLQSSISGGSLVVFASKTLRHPSERLVELRGHYRENPWADFASGAYGHRRDMNTILGSRSDRRMIGYGASARAATLLGFCGINQLLAIADRNPMKHDRWMADTDVQIVSPEAAMRMNPDVVLLLAWNFEQELISEMKALGFVGEVIVPLPNSPKVVVI